MVLPTKLRIFDEHKGADWPIVKRRDPRGKVQEFTMFYQLNVAGWWFQPIQKILVSWDDYSQYMEK